MSAIIVAQFTLPESVVLSQAGLDTRDALALTAHEFSKHITAENHARADAHYKAMIAFEKDIEETRKAIKAPVDQVAKDIQEAARLATAGIADEKQRLGVALHTYTVEENRRREAEAKRIRDEAEAKARFEQDRLNAEAKLRAELAALPGDEPVVVTAPQILVRTAKVMTQAPLKSAVKAVPKDDVIIDDRSVIPFMANGICLWKELDLAALKMLLKAGVVIAGCHLETSEDVRSKGARA